MGTGKIEIGSEKKSNAVMKEMDSLMKKDEKKLSDKDKESQLTPDAL